MCTVAREDELAETIRTKTLQGEHFGPEGAIALHQELFRQTYSADNPGVLINMASTYYAAGGHAWAKASTRRLDKLKWMFLAGYYMFKACRLAHKYEQLVSLPNMNSDELSIYAAILLVEGEANKAALCIDIALERKGLPIDTIVLLLIKRGEIFDSQNQRPEANQCYSEAGKIISETTPQVQARYYRSLAWHNQRAGNIMMASLWRYKASMITRKHDLRDQAVKNNAWL